MQLATIQAMAEFLRSGVLATNSARRTAQLAFPSYLSAELQGCWLLALGTHFPLKRASVCWLHNRTWHVSSLFFSCCAKMGARISFAYTVPNFTCHRERRSTSRDPPGPPPIAAKLWIVDIDGENHRLEDNRRAGFLLKPMKAAKA
jgi:hypothetical protein